MTQSSNERRLSKYVDAIRDEVDNGDVTCVDAGRAVMALAVSERDAVALAAAKLARSGMEPHDAAMAAVEAVDFFDLVAADGGALT